LVRAHGTYVCLRYSEDEGDADVCEASVADAWQRNIDDATRDHDKAVGGMTMNDLLKEVLGDDDMDVEEVAPSIEVASGANAISSSGLELAAKRGGRGGGRKAGADKENRPPAELPPASGLPPASEPGALQGRTAGPGRKRHDTSELAAREWRGIQASGPDSLYFGDQHSVHMKCLRRYIDQANGKLKSNKEDDKASLEIAAKQFQIVKDVASTARSWLTRNPAYVNKAILEFTQSWQFLTKFLDEAPKLEFKCEFFSEMMLEVLAFDFRSGRLPDALAESNLGSFMGGNVDTRALQVKHTRGTAIMILCKQ